MILLKVNFNLKKKKKLKKKHILIVTGHLPYSNCYNDILQDLYGSIVFLHTNHDECTCIARLLHPNSKIPGD